MSAATFVACPECGRLMLGQRAYGGVVYPQPHKCDDEASA